MHLKETCIGLMVLALSVLSGCGAPPKFIVKQGSELATVVALTKIEATKDEAHSVSSTALTVENVLVSGEIDADAIKQQVLRSVVEKFDEPTDRLVMLLLVNSITDLIVENLNNNNPTTPIKEDLVVLVVAAAQGVQDGVKLYVASLPQEAQLDIEIIIEVEAEAEAGPRAYLDDIDKPQEAIG